MDLEYVVCPVCGPGYERVWLDDGKPTRYVRCTCCGTVFASPRASHSHRHAWLDETFAVSDRILPLTASRMPALEREARLIQDKSRGGRILDIGCSIGAFLGLFPQESWTRYGVEPSDSAAEYAVQHHGIQVHTGFLASAGFPKCGFDVVTLIDTLFYLDDPQQDFQEIGRILKPGGLLAIENPGQAYILWRNYGLVPRVFDGHWSRAASDSSYTFWFSPSGLEKLLRKTGFEPISWHVVTSPRSANPLLNNLTKLHFAAASLLEKLSSRALAWAPKYLVLARREQPKDEW